MKIGFLGAGAMKRIRLSDAILSAATKNLVIYQI